MTGAAGRTNQAVQLGYVVSIKMFEYISTESEVRGGDWGLDANCRVY